PCRPHAHVLQRLPALGRRHAGLRRTPTAARPSPPRDARDSARTLPPPRPGAGLSTILGTRSALDHCELDLSMPSRSSSLSRRRLLRGIALAVGAVGASSVLAARGGAATTATVSSSASVAS